MGNKLDKNNTTKKKLGFSPPTSPPVAKVLSPSSSPTSLPITPFSPTRNPSLINTNLPTGGNNSGGLLPTNQPHKKLSPGNNYNTPVTIGAAIASIFGFLAIILGLRRLWRRREVDGNPPPHNPLGQNQGYSQVSTNEKSTYPTIRKELSRSDGLVEDIDDENPIITTSTARNPLQFSVKKEPDQIEHEKTGLTPSTQTRRGVPISQNLGGSLATSLKNNPVRNRVSRPSTSTSARKEDSISPRKEMGTGYEIKIAVAPSYKMTNTKETIERNLRIEAEQKAAAFRTTTQIKAKIAEAEAAKTGGRRTLETTDPIPETLGEEAKANFIKAQKERAQSRIDAERIGGEAGKQIHKIGEGFFW